MKGIGKFIIIILLFGVYYQVNTQPKNNQNDTILKKQLKLDVKQNPLTKPLIDTLNAEQQYFELVTDSTEESEIPEYIYNLDSIPAHYLYLSWDTTDIHPYTFNYKTSFDSTLIQLDQTPNYQSFKMPVNGIITSSFGWRFRKPHFGTDIDLQTGDPVYAAFDGVVRISVPNRSYGKVVIIRHANELETYYAHLSKLNVTSGQKVKAGTLIGLGGNTGYSTGSHLHFEMRYLGIALDPEDFIDFKTGQLKVQSFKLTKDLIDKKYNLYKLGKKYKSRVYIKKGKKSNTKSHKVNKGKSSQSRSKKNKIPTKSTRKK